MNSSHRTARQPGRRVRGCEQQSQGSPPARAQGQSVTFRFCTVVAAMLASASAVRKALCGEMSTFGKLFSSWNFLGGSAQSRWAPRAHAHACLKLRASKHAGTSTCCVSFYVLDWPAPPVPDLEALLALGDAPVLEEQRACAAPAFAFTVARLVGITPARWRDINAVHFRRTAHIKVAGVGCRRACRHKAC